VLTWVFCSVVLAAILAITLWPTPVDRPVDRQLLGLLAWLHRAGMPGFVDYDFVQTASNVVMFLPLGVLVAILVTPSLWWASGVLGLTLSVGVELCQYLFLPQRFASLYDVASNTAGALLGGAIVALMRRLTRVAGRRRHRPE
jgi:glycopeptide antibiotics resistance protein